MAEENTANDSNEGERPNVNARSSVGVNLAWLLFWAIAAIGGFFCIPNLVTGGAEGIQKRAEAHEAAIARLKEEMGDVVNQRDQSRSLRARASAERRQRELESALGGPVRAAFANPSLSILQAMEKALQACAPPNARAEVRVDRFTEFTATISTAEALSTNQMSTIARAFMPLAREYLEALRFSAKGEVVAELDRQDIELVENWATVPDARLAMLLAREIPGAVVADPKAVEKYQDEQRMMAALADEGVRAKATAVDREFRAAAQAGYDDLKAALDLSHQAVNTFEVKTLRDVDAREKSLRDAYTHAARAKAFWLAPAKVWEASMDAHGLTGDARAAFSKTLANSFHNDQPKSQALFTALDGLLESGRFLLRTLSENYDAWRYVPQDEGLSFRDAAVGAQVSRIREQLRIDLRALDDALRAWQESTPQ